MTSFSKSYFELANGALVPLFVVEVFAPEEDFSQHFTSWMCSYKVTQRGRERTRTCYGISSFDALDHAVSRCTLAEMGFLADHKGPLYLSQDLNEEPYSPAEVAQNLGFFRERLKSRLQEWLKLLEQQG